MTPELAEACEAAGTDTVTFMAWYLRNSRGSNDDRAYAAVRLTLAEVLGDWPQRGLEGPDPRLVDVLRREGEPLKLRYWMPLAEQHPDASAVSGCARVAAGLAAEVDAALMAGWADVAS